MIIFTGWVRIQLVDVIKTRLISILMRATMQLLEVVTGHSQFLSHFSILVPQAIPTQPVKDLGTVIRNPGPGKRMKPRPRICPRASLSEMHGFVGGTEFQYRRVNPPVDCNAGMQAGLLASGNPIQYTLL